MNKMKFYYPFLLRYLGIVTLAFLAAEPARSQHRVPSAFIGFNRVYSEELSAQYDEYNFWNGHWKANWKSWKEKEEYVSSGYALHRVFSVLDGKAMIELVYSDSIVGGSKTAGFSIRYFDSGLKKWVMLQSWPGRNSPNISSLQGTHHHGRIQLYQFGQTSTSFPYAPPGTEFANRYTFSDAGPDSFRWDSAISTDSMRTWFTRSLAEFSRIDDFHTLVDEEAKSWYSYGDGYNCDDSVLQAIRPFLGEWEGMVTHYGEKESSKEKITRVLMPFLSNCAVMGYQTYSEAGELHKEINFATYLPGRRQWVFYTLDNVPGESQTLYFSDNISKTTKWLAQKEFFDVPSSKRGSETIWEILDNGKMAIQEFDANKVLLREIRLDIVK